MSNNADDRADPFNDVGDPPAAAPGTGGSNLAEFKPKPRVPTSPEARQGEMRALDEIARTIGFPSRSPQAVEGVPAATGAKAQRHHRTGRNTQFNIKASPAAIAKFEEFRVRLGVTNGDLLERLLVVYEQQLAGGPEVAR